MQNFPKISYKIFQQNYVKKLHKYAKTKQTKKNIPIKNCYISLTIIRLKLQRKTHTYTHMPTFTFTHTQPTIYFGRFY